MALLLFWFQIWRILKTKKLKYVCKLSTKFVKEDGAVFDLSRDELKISLRLASDYQ